MLSVKFVDCNRSEENKHVIFRPDGSKDYLFLYFPKRIKIKLNGEYLITKKNACIIYAPEDYQYFTGAPEFVNSYIHFQCTDTLYSGIKTSTLFYPENYSEMNLIIAKIKNEHLSAKLLKSKMESDLLSLLLILAARHFDEPEKNILKEQFEKIRYEMLSDYSRNISPNIIAKNLCMSRSSFYNYYKLFFNSSPKNDLLMARMENANVFLTSTNMTVSEVASKVGFESTEHFIRYYKKYFGKSPRKYNFGQNINRQR